MPHLDDEDLRRIVLAVRAVFNAEQSVSGEIAEKWTGGQVLLKPGKDGTQEKTIPIDVFFRKVVGVRDRLRVLEQKINTHPKLTDADRVELHDYITRAYGSLTTFNLLFADPADRFIVATAMATGATLVTADHRILRWPGTLNRHDARR